MPNLGDNTDIAPSRQGGRTHLLLGGRHHLDQAACGRIAGDYKRFRVTFGADHTTCRDCLRETGFMESAGRLDTASPRQAGRRAHLSARRLAEIENHEEP